jgi:hypothetical protein
MELLTVINHTTNEFSNQSVGYQLYMIRELGSYVRQEIFDIEK